MPQLIHMILAWRIYFIDFPQVRLYVFAHVTLVWCQHFRTCGVQWRQFTKCSDPCVLWRLATQVLLVQNLCFRSRIIDETLMFNCTPGLVISPLYRRVSTSGPYIVVIPHTFWPPSNPPIFSFNDYVKQLKLVYFSILFLILLYYQFSVWEM